MEDRKRSKFTECGAKPIVGGIAAVVSILAGSLASFFTASIRASIGLPKDPADGNSISFNSMDWTGEAGLFWGLILVAIFLFTWSKFSDGTMTKENHDDLATLLDDLRTLPPPSCLQTFQSAIHLSHRPTLMALMMEAGNDGFSEADRKNRVEETIRLILGNIIKLASEFKSTKANLGANIMLFSKEDWDETKLGKILDVGHLPRGAHIGTLVIDPSLSTASGALGQPDAGLPALALPVHKPEPKTTTALTNILPGAPETFLTGCFYSCPSHAHMFRHLDARYADKNQAEALKKYFNSPAGKTVQSFVCIPIMRSNIIDSDCELSAEEKFLGVLNIHSSEPDFLPRGAELFWPLVSPLMSFLTFLIEARNEPSV